MYESVNASGVVEEDVVVLSEFEYVPEIVPVTVGNFEPFAKEIISLDSISFSSAIFTLGLFLIVFFIVSSIFKAYECLKNINKIKIINKFFKIQNLPFLHIVHN